MQLGRGAHGILGSRNAEQVPGLDSCIATVWLRPAAAPAAEASPEPVPVHLPGRLLAGRLAHFKDLCEMVP